MVLISTFSALQSWGSSEVQDVIEGILDQPYLDQISIDDALVWGQWLVTVVLVASVAALVFAVFTARRHRASRIALTILSGLAAVAFFFAGLAGIIPAVVAAITIFLLWNKDANAYFSGQPEQHAVLTAPPAAGSAPEREPSTDTSQGTVTTADPQPAAPGVQAPPASPLPPYGQPIHPAKSGPVGPRPGIVTAGIVVAFVSSVLGVLISAALALAAIVATDAFAEELTNDRTIARILETTEFSSHDLVIGIAVFGVFSTLFGMFGIAVTIVAWRGSNVGRILLIVASCFAIVAGIATLFLGVVVIAAGVFTIVSMSVRPASQWYNGGR